ncbi:helix-turn-helix domain-containing protein [Snodgrassella sp. CFCC 13594]|uniref:winged helix-turn-helix transcriptional regulator n=1 Tax=Snodgrassella sp. CFCC 13594 TaxID=1775559 RepID=UPI00082AD1A5|nr:helix-turn-helix domain-containing protein [Snodgrassella sp. CFCC 13594]
MNPIEKNKIEGITPTSCPVNRTLQVIGGKWKALIVYHLMDTTQRFNELRRLMPDITQRMLTLQLREMETDGIVHREVYAQVPPKVEYSLTRQGQSLITVIMAMHEWGIHHAPPSATTESNGHPTSDLPKTYL